MLKLTTPVSIEKTSVHLSLENRTLILGSCFADNVGAHMADAGFQACINPFGTLYNPSSILSALKRLSSAKPFCEDDCVQMGAGAGLWCSFSHHSSFARETKEEFLEHANKVLAKSAAFWESADTVIITLGTAMVWRGIQSGEIVSNCLKRPACDFSHELLSLDEVKECLQEILSLTQGKRVIFTVSPIRHLSLGAHNNAISKATLLLAVESTKAEYFPSYEIVMDELRDYRFCAEDLIHPSPAAVSYIWERFVQAYVPQAEWQRIKDNEKAARRNAHRPILHR